MAIVCCHVRAQYAKANKWKFGQNSSDDAVGDDSAMFSVGEHRCSKRLDFRLTARQPMQGRVFAQSVFYLLAFYAVWPIYITFLCLANPFTPYGWWVFVVFLAPTQGSWNFLTYIRPRFLKQMDTRQRARFLRTASSLTMESKQASSSFFMSKSNLSAHTQEKPALECASTVPLPEDDDQVTDDG